jgi:hypothetical protein
LCFQIFSGEEDARLIYLGLEYLNMRNLLLTGMCILVPVIAGCNGSSSDNSTSSNTTTSTTASKSTIAVIGDAPYGSAADDTAEFNANPAFINAINQDQDVSLVLHAGDIHSGKQYCTYDYNMAIYNQWSAFADPLVYTPGDNEWTDCHKKKEGGGAYNPATFMIDYVLDAKGNWVDYAGGDPAANLDLVRSIFFAVPGKTLGASMDVHSQATEYDAAHPTDSDYVENVWFEKAKVLFATFNIPGGSNNDTDAWYGTPTVGPVQAQEVSNRTAADLRWLDTAFAKAKANGDVAVVLMEQADMWDFDGSPATHLAQYKQFIDKIATLSTAFGKPVLLINGDSHVYRADNPLVQGAACVIETASGVNTAACTAANMPAGTNNPADPYQTQPYGYNVPNFHRIVVHGNATPSGTKQEYVKLSIDPAVNVAASANAFGPFSWTRIQP